MNPINNLRLYLYCRNSAVNVLTLQNKVSIGLSTAVVVNEYGGTSGIVSIEELIGEIVGEVSEELVAAESEFEVLGPSNYQIEGSMRVDEANEQLNLGIPENDYETIAGFVLHTLGHFPEEGEQFVHGNLTAVVTAVKASKIVKLLITKEEPLEPPDSRKTQSS
jgi:putative hemolysin